MTEQDRIWIYFYSELQSMYDIDELEAELVTARTREEEFSIGFNSYRIDYGNGMMSISSFYLGENLKFTFSEFMNALDQPLKQSKNPHAHS